MSVKKKVTSIQLQSIESRLKSDGLNDNLSVDEKLCHLWNCLTRSEDKCTILTAEISQLRSNHANELEEITRSMRKLSSISAGKDELLAQCENENSQLKTKLKECETNTTDPKLPQDINKILISEGYSHLANGSIQNQFMAVISVARRNEEDLKLLKIENSRLFNSLNISESKERQTANELRLLKEASSVSKREKELSHNAEMKILGDVKSKLERDFSSSNEKVKEMQELVSCLNKKRDVEKINHEHDMMEITRALEDELLKAVELQEEERRITCQKISENSKLLVENRLLQAKFSKLEIELSRAKALITSLEDTNSQVSSKISQLLQSSENTAAEIEKSRLEFDRHLAEAKDSFMQEKSVLEESYQSKIENSRREIERLKNALKTSHEQSEEHVKTIKALEINFIDLQSVLKTKELESDANRMKVKDLEHADQSLRTQLGSVITENKCYENIILTKQRESEDLKMQIEDANKKLDDIQNRFKLEEEKNLEIGRKLVITSGELASLQEHNIQLKYEIHSMTSQFTRHQDMSLKEQERLQTVVKELKGELEVLKDSSQKDKAKSVDMEQTMNSEIAQLTSSLMEINLENDKLKDTVQRLSTVELDLKAAISKESKGKVFAEAGLLDMEGELDTARQKNIELAQTIVALENVKTHQEKENDLKGKMLEQLQKQVKKREDESTSLYETTKKLQAQIQEYELKIEDLNMKMELAEQKLQRSSNERHKLAQKAEQLQKNADENLFLKNRLTDEEESRMLQSSVITEFQKQLTLLEKNADEKEFEIGDLLRTVEEQRVQLNDLQQRQRMSRKENGYSSGRIIELTKENESLKLELTSTFDAFDDLKRKFDEQAINTENEFRTLGNRCSRERYALETFIGQLRKNLEISQGRINKEAEWKDNSDAKYRQVKEQNMALISEMSSLQEKLFGFSVDHRKLILKIDHLEKENTQMRSSIANLTQEKLMLEKSCLKLEENNSNILLNAAKNVRSAETSPDHERIKSANVKVSSIPLPKNMQKSPKLKYS